MTGGYTIRTRQRVAFSLIWIAMLAVGYLVGWIHGAAQYQRSAVWFMAGIVVTALFVGGLFAIESKKAEIDK